MRLALFLPALLTLGITGAGCAYLGRGVPVYREGGELDALVGIWEGDKGKSLLT